MGDTSLYQNLLCNASFYRLLLQLDDDLAAEARRRGCACGDRLDSACYPRKPRGVPKELEDAYSCRHSFCCAKEGCRKRTTPPSFRFLGRKVFVGAVVVLITVLRHGATPARMAKLRKLVGVSRRTVEVVPMMTDARPWTQDELTAYARVLGVSVSDLLGRGRCTQ